MRTVRHYESEVVTAAPTASARALADRMDAYAVGCVVVVDGERAPVGIVTDRDLVRRVVAPGRDADKTRAADVMTAELVLGSSDDRLEWVVSKMKARAVRRLPIVRDGRLVGIVTLDDVVSELGRECRDLRAALRSEVLGARREAGRRRRREELEAALAEVRATLGELGAQSQQWLRRELRGLRRWIEGSRS